MTDRYERIRRALEMGPTPGPWEVVGLSGYGGPYALRMPHRSGRTWYGVEGIKQRKDAEYFVACDPDTVRALLEERDGLTAENARLREDAARLDWLDSMSARLNQHYGTQYQWELAVSPNIVRLMFGAGGNGHVAAIDLNDSAANGVPSCREAIDRARRAREGG